MNDNTAQALVLVLAFFVAVCIVSILGGRLVRPPCPVDIDADSDYHLKHAPFLPCAQPMTPWVRSVYLAVIVILLLACVGINYWPGKTPAPLACQVSDSAGS